MQLTRRRLVQSTVASALVGTTALIGCGGSGSSSSSGPSGSRPNAEDFLNYLLNLEYLEAEFYLRATTGTGLAAGLIGSTPGPVTGGAKVPFQTPLYQAVATQFAQIEQDHVTNLRGLLYTGAISRPAINLTQGFSAVGAGSGLGASFDPFADETSFLLGSFFLGDLIATAYAGAFGANPGPLGSILDVECYQAGALRTLVVVAGGAILSNAEAIVSYRGTYGSGAEGSLESGSQVSLAAEYGLGQSQARSPGSVLGLLYHSPSGAAGSFFPNRLNGFIS